MGQQPVTLRQKAAKLAAKEALKPNGPAPDR
jgi:hypothetical protein